MAKITTNTPDADIKITPNGTGKTIVGTGAASATVQSSGDFDLVLQTGNATTGSITITDGADGNITITPNGTGTVVVNTDLDVDNININGNAITSTNTNGNIAITPNGTGEVDISKVDIDGGTIDGVTIGGSSAGAVTTTSLVATTADINGGTIDGTTIGGTTQAAGSFTQVNAGDGAEATPSITNTGDTNTGIYFPAADTVGVSTGGTERMRIDSSGNLLVNCTTIPSNTIFGAGLIKSGSVVDFYISSNSTASDRLVWFFNPNGLVGGITTSGSATAYVTSSDYRLKTDVQPMTGATERLKALNPVNFAWKIDGSRVDGFLAHEAQEVVPEAVTGEKDAMRTEEYEVTPAVLDDDGNVVTEAVMGTREVPDYQGIDQAKLVPLLTAALQEAVSKIEALTARIEVLENTAG